MRGRTPDPAAVTAVLEHVGRYPGLSSFAIGRALGWSKPNNGWGTNRAWRILLRLEAQELVKREAGPRDERDTRPTVRWWLA
jgi:DNA-binding MarR family transcriptional regulator